MSAGKSGAWVLMLLLLSLFISEARAGHTDLDDYVRAEPIASPPIAFITAEELKAIVAKKQRVTVIDVRSSSALLDSGIKIKGAIYVKLRRLKYRLGFPPLKDVPRDSEVVTYCACPNDEAALRAAQLLLDSGFKHVRALKGGIREWQKANGPIESQRGI